MLVCAWKKSILTNRLSYEVNAMIRLSVIIGQFNLCCIWGYSYVAGEQLGKLLTTVLLLNMFYLETLFAFIGYMTK